LDVKENLEKDKIEKLSQSNKKLIINLREKIVKSDNL